MGATALLATACGGGVAVKTVPQPPAPAMVTIRTMLPAAYHGYPLTVSGPVSPSMVTPDGTGETQGWEFDVLLDDLDVSDIDVASLDSQHDVAKLDLTLKPSDDAKAVCTGTGAVKAITYYVVISSSQPPPTHETPPRTGRVQVTCTDGKSSDQSFN